MAHCTLSLAHRLYRSLGACIIRITLKRCNGGESKLIGLCRNACLAKNLKHNIEFLTLLPTDGCDFQIPDFDSEYTFLKRNKMQNFNKMGPTILVNSLETLFVSLEKIVPLLLAVCNFEQHLLFSACFQGVSLFPGCHDIIEL